MVSVRFFVQLLFCLFPVCNASGLPFTITLAHQRIAIIEGAKNFNAL